MLVNVKDVLTNYGQDRQVWNYVKVMEKNRVIVNMSKDHCYVTDGKISVMNDGACYDTEVEVLHGVMVGKITEIVDFWETAPPKFKETFQDAVNRSNWEVIKPTSEETLPYDLYDAGFMLNSKYYKLIKEFPEANSLSVSTHENLPLLKLVYNNRCDIKVIICGCRKI